MFNTNSFYLTVWHFVLHVEPCAWLQLLVNFESLKVQVEGVKVLRKEEKEERESKKKEEERKTRKKGVKGEMEEKKNKK